MDVYENIISEGNNYHNMAGFKPYVLPFIFSKKNLV